MIAYLRGKVVLSQNNFVILETNGVGHCVFVKPSMIDSRVMGHPADGGVRLPEDDSKELEFFIHHHLRENAEDLYGFATHQELEMFEKLISVNGVGPKAAMSILSAAPLEKIIKAITSDDVAFFTTLPGIGKKVSAKIILDLRKKVSGIESSGIIGKMDDADDVVESLTALGYKKFEVAKALAKMPADVSSIEEKIRWCLKNLAKQ